MGKRVWNLERLSSGNKHFPQTLVQVWRPQHIIQVNDFLKKNYLYMCAVHCMCSQKHLTSLMFGISRIRLYLIFILPMCILVCHDIDSGYEHWVCVVHRIGVKYFFHTFRNNGWVYGARVGRENDIFDTFNNARAYKGPRQSLDSDQLFHHYAEAIPLHVSKILKLDLLLVCLKYSTFSFLSWRLNNVGPLKLLE